MHNEWAQHPTVDSFATAVLDVFGTQPWALAEPYIERAWDIQRLESDPAWSEIRDALRVEWQVDVIEQSEIGTGELLP